jgi:uncharacterized protein YggU (UPF0235/DUF167 family)
MLHGGMGTVTVRVVPRAGRTAVEAEGGRILIRVRAAAEGGRATEEARRALARAAGVPAGSVRLRVGGRTRAKVFEVAGLGDAELERRLHGT